jgi:hypothetical protein
MLSRHSKLEDNPHFLLLWQPQRPYLPESTILLDSAQLNPGAQHQIQLRPGLIGIPVPQGPHEIQDRIVRGRSKAIILSDPQIRPLAVALSHRTTKGNALAQNTQKRRLMDLPMSSTDHYCWTTAEWLGIGGGQRQRLEEL